MNIEEKTKNSIIITKTVLVIIEFEKRNKIYFHLLIFKKTR